MKTFSVAILGCGSRGAKFAVNMLSLGQKYKVVALCDINEAQIEKTKKLCGLTDVVTSTDPDAFLEKKYAEVLVIATLDRYHVPQAVRAMRLGYDILLEKPISDDREELALFERTQKETGARVVVCHELRYGPGFRKCSELLESGVVGTLYAIDHTERVWYAHWAQGYVRGMFASLEKCHPAILAKCSHDLDLIAAWAKSPCKTVSSVGELRFFRPENAPEGAAARCIDCQHKDTCAYSAKRMYIDLWYERGKPEYRWPFYSIAIDKPTTEEKLLAGLRTSPLGRCAFGCKVDMVDHQLVQMEFENGVKASLKMLIANREGRRVVFYGSLGEIVFDERTKTIDVMPYGGEAYTLDVRTLGFEDQSHGGGDLVLVDEMYDYLSGKTEASTAAASSIEPHLMGIAAEESRKRGGALVWVHNKEE